MDIFAPIINTTTPRGDGLTVNVCTGFDKPLAQLTYIVIFLWAEYFDSIRQ